MNRDTNLFVQAFGVKCRETIRPELDFTVDDLKNEGHDAHVATPAVKAEISAWLTELLGRQG